MNPDPAENDDVTFRAIAELYRRSAAQTRINIAMMIAVGFFSVAELLRWIVLLWA